MTARAFRAGGVMSDRDGPCPYCGGKGMKILQQNELIVEGRRVASETSAPCICTLNRYVSDRHERLAGVGYVEGLDSIRVYKELPLKDMIFYGSESLFLYVVKAFLIIHFPFNRRFGVLTGADIAEKYAMAQPNGVIPTVDLLTPLDLLAILCVARVNNRAIAPGTQEVMANRIRSRRPTWIYAPDNAALLGSKEFAADESRGSASDLIAGWPSLTVDNVFPNLKGYRAGETSPSASARKAQSMAANM